MRKDYSNYPAKLFDTGVARSPRRLPAGPVQGEILDDDDEECAVSLRRHDKAIVDDFSRSFKRFNFEQNSGPYGRKINKRRRNKDNTSFYVTMMAIFVGFILLLPEIFVVALMIYVKGN